MGHYGNPLPTSYTWYLNGAIVSVTTTTTTLLEVTSVNQEGLIPAQIQTSQIHILLLPATSLYLHNSLFTVHTCGIIINASILIRFSY